jgi:hypothetical protein
MKQSIWTVHEPGELKDAHRDVLVPEGSNQQAILLCPSTRKGIEFMLYGWTGCATDSSRIDSILTSNSVTAYMGLSYPGRDHALQLIQEARNEGYEALVRRLDTALLHNK